MKIFKIKVTEKRLTNEDSNQPADNGDPSGQKKRYYIDGSPKCGASCRCGCGYSGCGPLVNHKY